jgi:hypothetical protein
MKESFDVSEDLEKWREILEAAYDDPDFKIITLFVPMDGGFDTTMEKEKVVQALNFIEKNIQFLSSVVVKITRKKMQ